MRILPAIFFTVLASAPARPADRPERLERARAIAINYSHTLPDFGDESMNTVRVPDHGDIYVDPIHYRKFSADTSITFGEPVPSKDK